MRKPPASSASLGAVGQDVDPPHAPGLGHRTIFDAKSGRDEVLMDLGEVVRDRYAPRNDTRQRPALR
jgi:hypothetical protein